MSEQVQVTGWESASALLEALAAGSVTSVQLLQLFLARIRAESWVNAVVTIAEEQALLEAEQCDAERAAGRLRGPLHGLPMTVKDDLLVAGMGATYGAVENAEYVAEEDAPLVQNLRAAGAIIFGKTNLPRLAGDGQSYNELFGTTANPWDAERTCGGSSGGSAAAVAAGMTSLELGSDMGGSIRIPAAWCGVYGLKPTWGILPLGGSAPVPGEEIDPIGLLPADIAMHGPIARSASDLSVALDVLRGGGRDDDRFERPATPIDLGAVSLVAWLTEPGYETETQTLAVLEGLCVELERQGVAVDRVSRPPVGLERLEYVFETMFMAQKAASFDDETLAYVVEYFESREQEWELAGIHRRALTMSHREWLLLENERQELRQMWDDFFADGRLLLTPSVITTAIAHDHSEPAHERTAIVDGRQIIHRPHLTRWSGATGAAFLPALSIPAGLTAGGLPVGAQLSGPEYADYRVIAVAEAIEQAVGGYQRPHPLGGGRRRA